MIIVEKFQEGGFFMYFILLFGMLSVGFIIERVMALYVRYKNPAADFRLRLLDFISKADFRGAEQYARSVNPQTSLAVIAETGCRLRASAVGEEELQARMDEQLSAEIAKIDRRTGFLAMFGNVSTLLGLLGTISGMIISFASVAQGNPAERATLLSAGISEAMNCTAFGLLVAIPALVAYAVFQNRTDRVVTELTQETSRIFHDLLFLTETPQVRVSEKATSGAGLANPQPVGV
jgi:biopolymer transport protein ExbB